MSTWNPALGPFLSSAILASVHRVAMLGIGGVGMYGLATLLTERGVEIVGQDLVEGPYVKAIRSRGATVQIGEKIAEPLLSTAQCVIYSSAIAEDHPNLRQARERGIPCLSRADALAGIMGNAFQIAVAGTHGKSTATTMLSHIFREAGRDPTVLVGAEPVADPSPVHIGSQGYIYEACEYMGSFWSFQPSVALILGAEQDHVDCYPTGEAYGDAYVRFLAGADRAVVCASDREALRASKQGCKGEVLSYSIDDPKGDLAAQSVQAIGRGWSFCPVWRGKNLGRWYLPLPGRFNVENALGAILVALSEQIEPEVIRVALSKERGVKRRLERVGTVSGAGLYEDYAHHPTEICASLSALRSVTSGRLYCVFQSHTYSRTAAYLSEIGQGLRLADRAWILPIYGAREQNTSGVDALSVVRATGEKVASYAADAAEAWDSLVACLAHGDTAVLMGAGSIHDQFSEFVAKFASDP